MTAIGTRYDQPTTDKMLSPTQVYASAVDAGSNANDVISRSEISFGVKTIITTDDANPATITALAFALNPANTTNPIIIDGEPKDQSGVSSTICVEHPQSAAVRASSDVKTSAVRLRRAPLPPTGQVTLNATTSNEQSTSEKVRA